jgi:hypothetical protein
METAIDYSTIEKYTRHGGAYDRGRADFWYWRKPEPHYYVGNTYSSEKVTNLTQEEMDAYYQGYKDYESQNLRKDWGE